MAVRPFSMARTSGGQHADFLQHGGMGQRAEDVLFPEPPIKGDGLGEFGRGGIQFGGEPAAGRLEQGVSCDSVRVSGAE